jgi:hypothetical protein
MAAERRQNRASASERRANGHRRRSGGLGLAGSFRRFLGVRFLGRYAGRAGWMALALRIGVPHVSAPRLGMAQIPMRYVVLWSRIVLPQIAAVRLVRLGCRFDYDA